MYLLAVCVFLFALAVVVWCLLDSRRAVRASRRPILECLPDRICPSTATWIGQATAASWEDSTNWLWDNVNL